MAVDRPSAGVASGTASSSPPAVVDGMRVGRSSPGRWAWRLVGLAVLLLLAALPLKWVFTQAPWIRMVDLEVYREAGESVVRGRGVYDYLTPQPNLLPFTYPPAATVVAVPLAVLSATATGIGWTLAQVAALAYVVSVTFRPLLRRCGRAAPVVGGTIAGLLCWLVPVTDGLKLGQVNLFLIALVVADLVAGRGPRGVLTGVATAIKLTPGVFLVHLWLARRRSSALTLAATVVAMTVLAAAVLPHDTWTYWTSAIVDPNRLGPNRATTNQSIRGVLERVGPHGLPGDLLWVASAGAVAAYGLRGSVRAARQGDHVRVVAIGGLLAALLSPVAWIHHYAWVVVALAALLGDGRRALQWARTLAWGAFWAVPVPYLGVRAIIHDHGPYLLARTVQQSYCIGAIVLVVILCRIRQRDAVSGAGRSCDG